MNIRSALNTILRMAHPHKLQTQTWKQSQLNIDTKLRNIRITNTEEKTTAAKIFYLHQK